MIRLRNNEIINRLSFTVIIIFIYRVLANIPLPGIDMEVYQSQFGVRATSEANYLLSIFTGGLLDTPSIVGLGIGVYITASIIIQLLTSVVPKLEELSKEGARGKQVIDQYTRYLTLPLSFVYGIGYLVLLSQQPIGSAEDGSLQYLVRRGADGALSPTNILFMAVVLTAGSLLIMWLAELITERGLGNGASIMIMLGILSTLPTLVRNDFSALNPLDEAKKVLAGEFSALGSQPLVIIYGIAFAAVLLIAVIIFVTESTRKLPIQYARRQRSGGVQESHLPLKLNQTGVLPIIFASALLTMPQVVLPLLTRFTDPSSPLGQFAISLQSSFLFNSNSNEYSLVYFVLIVIFSLFYVFIAFKPDQVAENLQKSGAFIPGIRPGKTTENYITRVLVRLTIVGAIFLGLIALVPLWGGRVLLGITGQQFTIFSAIGGTSILIVIGVVLESIRQLRSLRASQNYEKYI